MDAKAWYRCEGGDQSIPVYFSATRGFKSGGFNLTSQVVGRGFAPRVAWSYEGGLKSTVAQGRASVNVAAFYMDYSDLQVQTAIFPGSSIFRMRPRQPSGGSSRKARCASGEAPRPVGTWPGSLRRTDRYIAVGVGGVTADVAGHRLSNAPEWSGRLWIGWSGVIGGGARVSVHADARSQSTVYYTPFNDNIQRQVPYGLLDLSAELRARNGRWAVGVFARNMTNEDYITGTFSSPPPPSVAARGIRARPGCS